MECEYGIEISSSTDQVVESFKVYTTTPLGGVCGCPTDIVIGVDILSPCTDTDEPYSCQIDFGEESPIVHNLSETFVEGEVYSVEVVLSPINNEEELLSDYIYNNMEATSIIGGDDGASSVGWNDRSLTTTQGVSGIQGLSVNNNIITLTESGRYYLKARTGAYKAEYTKTRISFLSGDYLNVNFVGPQQYSNTSNESSVVSESVTIVDITETTTFEIQTHVQSADDDGLTNGGGSTLLVQKLADAEQLDLFLQHWQISQSGNLLPKNNNSVDIGNAEKKVRDIYEQD
jgi:hypothetical protein